MPKCKPKISRPEPVKIDEHRELIARVCQEHDVEPQTEYGWYDAILFLRAMGYWTSYHVLRAAVGHDVLTATFSEDDLLRIMRKLDEQGRWLPVGSWHLHKMPKDRLVALISRREFIASRVVASRQLTTRELVELIADECDQDLQHMLVVELADRVVDLERQVQDA